MPVTPATQDAQGGCHTSLAGDDFSSLPRPDIWLFKGTLSLMDHVVPSDRKHNALTPVVLHLTPKPKTKGCPPYSSKRSGSREVLRWVEAWQPLAGVATV